MIKICISRADFHIKSVVDRFFSAFSLKNRPFFTFFTWKIPDFRPKIDKISYKSWALAAVSVRRSHHTNLSQKLSEGWVCVHFVVEFDAKFEFLSKNLVFLHFSVKSNKKWEKSAFCREIRCLHSLGATVTHIILTIFQVKRAGARPDEMIAKYAEVLKTRGILPEYFLVHEAKRCRLSIFWRKIWKIRKKSIENPNFVHFVVKLNVKF